MLEGIMKLHCMSCMHEYDDRYDICPYCGYVRGTKAKEIYHLQPETILKGRYIVGVAVGSGGFGITYKAWDAQLEKLIAIKEFFPSGLVNRSQDGVQIKLYSSKNTEEYNNGLKRFLEEGKTAAKYSTHPNIVNVFDIFQENNTGYMVMEFLEGMSLKECILSNDGALDVDTTIEVLLGVISALKALHKDKILHRDISPDNIFVCVGNKVKLIDFGAARINRDEEKTLTIQLKPGYAPPEQYRNKGKLGNYTDIYALGATMYFAITGQLPPESVDRAIEDTMLEPTQINPDIPEYINNSLMTAMALTPELRFQNVAQFEDAILHQKRVVSLKAELKRRKRRRALIAGVIASVVLVGGLMSMFIYNKFKFDATLEATTIEVWIPGDSQSENNIFTQRIQNFSTDYPHIEIQLEVIPASEYYDRLNTAADDGQLPDLFVSTYAGDNVLKHTEELDDVFKVIDEEQLYLLEDYKDYFPNKNQMPTGIDVAICYENTAETQDKKTNDVDDFCQGTNAYLIAGTADYDEIQLSYGGKYKIDIPMACTDKTLSACFLETWSVGSSRNEAKESAAKRVIAYLLGDMGQDVYYVQNGNGTPINKACFSEYIKINWELKELEKYMDALVIDESNLFDMSKQCDEIYENLDK
ncbi:MAG: hypothetical protein E7257_09135 [Lachnospiraceae bacterium]|nr:hypothetical protein [Lachnospiraceae bacterium]